MAYFCINTFSPFIPNLLHILWSQYKEYFDEAHINQTEEDDSYYFFALHDLNHDEYLDGHELRVAFTEENFDPELGEHEPLRHHATLKEAEEMIDHVLEEDDIDGEWVFFLIRIFVNFQNISFSNSGFLKKNKQLGCLYQIFFWLT